MRQVRVNPGFYSNVIGWAEESIVNGIIIQYKDCNDETFVEGDAIGWMKFVSLFIFISDSCMYLF